MIPTTRELQRHLHDEYVGRLRSSMHRPPASAPRRVLGAWLVSAGLRLAPEEWARRAPEPLHRPEPSLSVRT